MATVVSLLASIQKQKDAILKKEIALKEKAHAQAITQIVQIAKDSEVSVSAIVKALNAGKPAKVKTAKSSKGGKKTGSRGTVQPKFRNPADETQIWSGRGRLPAWCARLQEAGQLDSALIANTAPVIQLETAAVH